MDTRGRQRSVELIINRQVAHKNNNIVVKTQNNQEKLMSIKDMIIENRKKKKLLCKMVVAKTKATLYGPSEEP